MYFVKFNRLVHSEWAVLQPACNYSRARLVHSEWAVLQPACNYSRARLVHSEWAALQPACNYSWSQFSESLTIWRGINHDVVLYQGWLLFIACLVADLCHCNLKWVAAHTAAALCHVAIFLNFSWNPTISRDVGPWEWAEGCIVLICIQNGFWNEKKKSEICHLNFWPLLPHFTHYET